MKKITTFIIMAMIAVGAHANSKENKADTLVVTTTPQMHCEGCENKIKSNIRFVKGVKKIETSVPRQEVKVVYNSQKATYEDFEKAFKRIGYEIQKKQ